MKKHNFIFTFLFIFFQFGCAQEKRPNILFIIADDISKNSFGVYGSKDIKTPHFDRIANEGVLFTNAYVSNPKCAPSRATILTGRYSWQLEEAANHNPTMPEKWRFYPELLEETGYAIGFTGKGWGPGHFYGKHNPAGWEYNKIKCKPPYKGISNKDYAANFEDFLTKKNTDKPFVFWLGTHEAHRAFEKDSYKKAGKDLNKIAVQNSFPDNKIVRGDLADYGLEVEYHDAHIGRALAALEKRGLLENTLIIATSDHGMPFPHIKGQIYDEGFHVGLVARWGNKIKAGRTVTDFINFPDIAPTLLEVSGVKVHQQMTGKSFLNLLLSKKSGRIDTARSFSILGKERHDMGRTDGEQLTVGYPVRAIRNDNYLYAFNYKPNRWPAGNPEYDYKNCDDSPTRQFLLGLEEDNPDYKYYELSFGKRPEEELYDINKDPDCVHNLASDAQFNTIKTEMKSKMEKELIAQKDPRVLGKGDIFDYYPHGRPDKLIQLYGEKYYDMYEVFYNKYGIRSVPISKDSLKINKKIIQKYNESKQ
ncbi:sulfatase [Polaribacter sp. Hel_I_88]|uniref:sulfatase family protein n=1 Tax=Polaribacter sp. Hel_I_88 TaxID=1250006 RepID=UPI0009DEEBAC|nr:sulfatase [Polaribacter sp. Hel_I_88]